MLHVHVDANMIVSLKHNQRVCVCVCVCAHAHLLELTLKFSSPDSERCILQAQLVCQ